MRFLTVATTVTLCTAIFSGCTNLTMLRTKELRAIKGSVDSLNTVLSTMQNKLFDEQKTHSEMLRLLRADQQVRFNEIDRKVTTIEGNLSENQYRLSKIDEKTAEFQKKFDAKLMSDSLAGNVQIAEIEKLFQIAMSDFNAGRYDIAQSGFRDLITQFPDAKITQDAEYWIAECSYASKVYAEAEELYLGYIKKYPQGSKMCVSLYKLGLLYDKQNKTKSKTMLWNKLIEQCPDSEEAKVAKSRLQ